MCGFFVAKSKEKRMKTKDFKVELKQADDGKPSITAYASTFDREPDCYGDVVAKGAFAKTLEEWRESELSIPLLFGHRTDDPMMNLGKVVNAMEDEKGLLIEAEFDMDNPNAVKARRDVLAGTLGKMSFAFEVLDEAPVELEGGIMANELREMKLFEVSLVPIPANQHAVVVDAKAATAEAEADEKAGRRNSAADEAELERVEELAEEIIEVVSGLTAAGDTEQEEPDEEPTEAKGAQPEEPTGAKADEAETEQKNEITESKETQMSEIINEIGNATVEVAEKAAKNLGEFVAKNAKSVAKGERFSMTTPLYKAATTVHTIGVQGATTDFDKNVYGNRPNMGVRDLFAAETISGNALTYYVEQAAEGAFDVVAEGGKKPQLHLPSEAKTVALKKIAGFMKESDEIIDDAPWMASAINNRGIYMLAVKEEAELVTDLAGTSGLGTATKGGAKLSLEDIKKAKTQVMTATGFAADAIVINPADYDEIVLGSMASHYTVNPWSAEEPRLWGMAVCQSSAIAAGTAIVGAFRQGASVVSKGGIQVEMTNSDADDFEHNLVAIRIEERLALAVRRPAAFVKIA